MMQTPRKKRNEGVALIIAMLIVVLLTVITVGYAYEMQVEASLVYNQMDELKSYLAAKSSISLGLSMLSADLLDPTAGVSDSMLDLWYVETHPDGLPFGLWQQMPSVDEGNNVPQEYLLKIEDEFGKFNINAIIDPQTLEPNERMVAILRNLFAQIGAEEDPTEAILDWIDQDTDGSFEDSYYSTLETPYVPKNRFMDSIEELLMVAGITPDLYFGNVEEDIPALYDLLTVHGHRRGLVNVNTARYELLRALGEECQIGDYAEGILAQRESAPYNDVSEIENQFNLNPPDDPNVPPPCKPPHTTLSQAFHVQGDGMVNGVVTRIDAYVWRDFEGQAERFRVLEWRVTR